MLPGGSTFSTLLLATVSVPDRVGPYPLIVPYKVAFVAIMMLLLARLNWPLVVTVAVPLRMKVLVTWRVAILVLSRSEVPRVRFPALSAPLSTYTVKVASLVINTVSPEPGITLGDQLVAPFQSPLTVLVQIIVLARTIFDTARNDNII